MAGWKNLADTCDPTSGPQLPEYFFSNNFTDDDTDPNWPATTAIKTAVFRIFTGDLDPDVGLYGGRELVAEITTDDERVSKRSIYDQAPQRLYDGHINRNIRAAMALIDLTKPYIWIKSAKQVFKI